MKLLYPVVLALTPCHPLHHDLVTLSGTTLFNHRPLVSSASLPPPPLAPSRGLENAWGFVMPHPAPLRQPVTNWDDLDSWLNNYVAQQYIPQLVQFGNFITAATRLNLDIKRSERKDIILSKVKDGFRAMMRAGNFNAYQAVRTQCEQAGRDVPSWNPSYNHAPPPTFGGVSVPSSSSAHSSSTGKLDASSKIGQRSSLISSVAKRPFPL